MSLPSWDLLDQDTGDHLSRLILDTVKRLPETELHAWYRFSFDLVRLSNGGVRVNHVRLRPIEEPAKEEPARG